MNKIFIFCFCSCIALFQGLFASENDSDDTSLNSIQSICETSSEERKETWDLDEGFDSWDFWIYDNVIRLGYVGGKCLGDKVSKERGWAFLRLFSPSFYKTHEYQFLFDANAMFFDRGGWMTNIGLGIRHTLPSQFVTLGFNIYYDYQRMHRFNYNQIGLGFELLGRNLDLRTNVYIPLGKKDFIKKHSFSFESDYYALKTNHFANWWGADLEVGTWLKKQHLCDWFGIYAAAGPYYYRRRGDHEVFRRHHKETVGGKLRLLARIFNFVDLSVVGGYDSLWKGFIVGKIEFTIPLDGSNIFFNQSPSTTDCRSSSPCLIDQINAQPVERNPRIISDYKPCWDWNWSTEDKTNSSASRNSRSRYGSSSSQS